MSGIFARFAVAVSALALTALSAQAQGAADYPNKPVRIVVSAAAGGGNDMIARIVSERLQAKWNQSFTVENRPGAGNNLAAEYVYRQPNDGYVILVSPPAPLVVNAALYKEMRFDPEKLEPVAISSYIPNVLAVRGNAPWKNAQEFIAYAKANPGKLNYGSQGNGTTGHLTAALFEMLIGAKHAHVPYGGAAPALNDLVAGHIDFMFADIGTVRPLAEGGKLKLLASTTLEPPAIAKDVPTIAAVGMQDLLSDTFTAFSGPP
ncbi:MAG: extracytoplasmic binding receptor, partial [Hyphomicrobiales bacterium]|nr:extracytoplasmic binding receptor [Hyphomicrobiales bacterium]